MFKRLGLALLAVALILSGIVTFRALSLESRATNITPAPAWEVDVQGAAERLAKGLRFRTISYGGDTPIPAEEFLGFRRHLEQSYPRSHAALELETVSEYSLLYTWKGRDPTLDPGLLMAHQDVVPADEGAWTHPPFDGEIIDGVIWGRGAVDDKGSAFMILEAVEALLADGFVPERTIHIFLGHDEEVGGPDGATVAARLFESRGTTLEWVLDEGGFVVEEMLPRIDATIALVGVAEKGSVTYRLAVETAGGHSSVPPRQTGIGILAEAITKLEANRVPGGLDDLSRKTLVALAPSVPFAGRAVLANLWLFEAILEPIMGRIPVADALQRTTTAVTIVNAGVKTNVLPSYAEATVNFRIRPGDTAAGIRDHVRRVIDDERVQILDPASSREASPVSDVESPAFALLERTVAEVFPGVPVVPYVVVGGTDSRQFYRVSTNVYRFNPFRFGREAATLPHGTDERIGVAKLGDAIRFYRRLISNSGS